MKIMFYILLFFGLFSENEAKFGWYPLEPGSDKFIYGVCFVDSLYGWAVGDEGLIIHTKDGGKNWTKQLDEIGSWLLSVHFVDRLNGWAVGDFGRVRYTTNGGFTWKIQPSLMYPEFLNSVYFIDKYNGWATGIQGIIHTSDGGQNWNYQTNDTITASKSIFFINKYIGWACGANGTIVKTVDGGENWFRQESGNQSIVYDVCFLDEYNGWAVCRYEPKILRTTNGGNSWIPNENEVPGFYKRIKFIDKNNGWAVGLGGIIKSSDGGKTWKTQIPDSRYNLWWADFTDVRNGWAVGGDGTLLKTVNGGFKFDVDFSSNVNSGIAPLSATFTDLSVGDYDEWEWDFGDGGTHKTKNPIYIYQQPGVYSVKLTVSDGTDSDFKEKINYITVNDPNPLIADFLADTLKGTKPLTVKFIDKSIGNPESWEWNFGDGGTHKTQNPLHVYQESGTFSVSLKIKKSNRTDLEIKNDYIIVQEPISIKQNNSGLLFLNIVPNPSSKLIQIELVTSEDLKYSLEVIDQKGQSVKNFGVNRVSDISVFTWNFISDENVQLADGIYYLIFRNLGNNQTVTKKIIYMR